MKPTHQPKLALILLTFVALTGCIRGKVYSLGSGVNPPLPSTMPRPEISAQARVTKPEGTVLIAAIISKTGIPQQLKIARSVDPEMDSKALAAVRGWKFKPGTKDGKPVRVGVHIEVQFNVI